MIATLFHESEGGGVYLVQSERPFQPEEVRKLEWLFSGRVTEERAVRGDFIGPRREMVTPWSTNASEICSNVGVSGIERIEYFRAGGQALDPMLEARYSEISAESLAIQGKPADPFAVDDISAFNSREGLALSEEEIEVLEGAAGRLGRKFTDSEIFAFAQINSEHCRHKIFRGSFVLDGVRQQRSLFDLIRRTFECAPENVVSAYRDNVAFVCGPRILRFAPGRGDEPAYFSLTEVETVISIKAETHNFPTTVEPFFGASTGTGGEIRDRMAGGRGGIPLTGTAVYMTSYPRLTGSSHPRRFDAFVEPRKWKYQPPDAILIKASNGASDFGNKFGQPITAGSLCTFEARCGNLLYAYDRVVMLAGGVGYALRDQALKEELTPGDRIVLLGGDNYRLGIGGGTVSSVATGAYGTALELSAVQRANPEMQKRVFNVIRALAEASRNPIKVIHDHGAGGHVNCFAEILEHTGGRIDIDRLPVGDPTLSVREILCNESQERMGLAVDSADVPLLERIARRERAPMYVVGEVTGDRWLVFFRAGTEDPLALPLEVLFGSSPETTIVDSSAEIDSEECPVGLESGEDLFAAVRELFSLEAVACKDWLTNKVDRCVSGAVALQQCVGPYQLPLANMSITALDYSTERGIVTALGHAPGAGLCDPVSGAVLSVAEALTNIIWTPLENGMQTIALSANWMWPARRPGEDVRLYRAVEGLSRFCCDLGIPVPTGKDSLSMTVIYDDASEVRAPGTVVVTAVGLCPDIRCRVTPALQRCDGSELCWIDLSGIEEFPLGGSSYAQTRGVLGGSPPTVRSAQQFRAFFEAIQALVRDNLVMAGHDISSGGMITSLCEMSFGGGIGIDVSLQSPEMLFCEKPGVIVQVAAGCRVEVERRIGGVGGTAVRLGTVGGERIAVRAGSLQFSRPIGELLRVWFEPSFLLDSKQTDPRFARERYDSVIDRELGFSFPRDFTGRIGDYGANLGVRPPSGVRAAIVREKGTNGDREMAFALYAAGFDVRDVTMSDVVEGREDLRDISLAVFPGGFSNSDVLGAGRGWAGVFKYNDRARRVLQDFFRRDDTLSLGVCNGCQLVAALELIDSENGEKLQMRPNRQGKFESAFIGVEVHRSASVFFSGLEGVRLGVWVAHGEGCFSLPAGEGAYDIPLRYVSAKYPGNPNGSDFNAAAISSRNGRHLIVMPHMERTLLPWQWAHYPEERRRSDEISPWILPFVAAREWCLGSVKDGGEP